MFAASLKLLLRAIRANLGPALLIWAIGGAVVAAYYGNPAVRDALEEVVRLRAQMGLLYPILSTALFGGVLPALSQALFAPRDWAVTRRSLHWIVVYWGLRGIDVDLFYRLQAWMWGNGSDPATLCGKVAVDMLVYNPLWACVTQVIFMRWLARRAGTLPATTPLLPKGWYGKLIIPLLVMTWALWIPAVTLIYSMPLPLQLPLANLILWLWMLILLFTSRNYRE